MTFAKRVQAIEPFLAVEISERAHALERAGADVVHLEFGEPDFEAPAVVREAAEKALKDGRTKYVSSLGILPLREAIAEHYRHTYGVVLSPEQILVTPGTSPAMLLLFGHMVDPGDEVILSDPYYACYPNFIRYAGGVPVYVPILEEEHFQYRPEEIARRRGPRTKAILVNSPANPTGAVLTVDRLEAIARHSEERGAFVVSDEIYHGLNYGDRDHSILEFTERAFVLNGFSKAFAMTGWRLGYAIGPRAHIRALQTLFGNFFIATNEFVQWAGLAALTDGAAESQRYRAIFDQRRRAMIARLRAIRVGVGFEPTGAFTSGQRPTL
jgi:aspartate/methionine/tyrosine aminotransferase